MKKLILMIGITFFLATTSVFAVAQDQKSVVEHSATSEKPVKNKAVRCNRCPNKCLIAPGKTGRCGQYININGKLVPNNAE